MRSSDPYRASACERSSPVEVTGAKGGGENGSARWNGASIPRAKPQSDGVRPMRRGECRVRVRGYVDVLRHGGCPSYRDDPHPPFGGCVFVRGSGVFRPLVRVRVSVGDRCRGRNPYGAWGAPMGGLRDCPCYPSMGPCRISIGTPSGNLFNTLSAPLSERHFRFSPF